MNIVTRPLLFMVLYCTAFATAMAQQQAIPPTDVKASAQAEAGEPRVDTSSSSANTAPKSTVTPSAVRGAPKAEAGQKTPPKADRVDLGTATVTGDREQPKVLYIVPWKRSDIGDLAGKPMNSLVDEILAPVDRDVFKREVVYYHAVQADASQNAGSSKPAQQGEK